MELNKTSGVTVAVALLFVGLLAAIIFPPLIDATERAINETEREAVGWCTQQNGTVVDARITIEVLCELPNGTTVDAVDKIIETSGPPGMLNTLLMLTLVLLVVLFVFGLGPRYDPSGGDGNE